MQPQTCLGWGYVSFAGGVTFKRKKHVQRFFLEKFFKKHQKFQIVLLFFSGYSFSWLESASHWFLRVPDELKTYTAVSGHCLAPWILGLEHLRTNPHAFFKYHIGSQWRWTKKTQTNGSFVMPSGKKGKALHLPPRTHFSRCFKSFCLCIFLLFCWEGVWIMTSSPTNIYPKLCMKLRTPWKQVGSHSKTLLRCWYHLWFHLYKPPVF